MMDGQRRCSRVRTGDVVVRGRRIGLLAVVVWFMHSNVIMLQAAGTTARSAAVERRAEQLRAAHRELFRRYAQTAREIAEQARTNGAVALERLVRSRIVPPSEAPGGGVMLPRKVAETNGTDVPPSAADLLIRWRANEKRYAADVYLLSRRALRADLPVYAYRLVQETLFHDPDHAAARRVMGFVRVGDEWLTPFAARMRREGKVWHDRFGWIPEKYVARYEAGERLTPRGWMTAAQEAAWRQDFRNGWVIETEHFRVKTNHSLEQGVHVARTLETFHAHLHRLLAGFFLSPEQLEAIFSGKAGQRLRYDPHEVYLFRSRQEYIDRLKARVPQIAISNGLYMSEDRRSYFFFRQDADLPLETTLFHEATHQLLYECDRRPRPIAEDAHFWVIEGIACYMESFRPAAREPVFGDPQYIRFRAARYRLEREGYYLPLAELDRLGRRAFHEHPNIRENYSQASGLVHYFMHYDGGRFRDALIAHLIDLYHQDPRRPRRVRGLDELTGVSFAEHDRLYKAYILTLGETGDGGS
ncbi:MAG: DUF1570 domain-containing protein [Planctomycetota bacterium]|nr:MAG: DUF1570 domain-containing protein [Planctomycetota bacterium]